ncbi:MAG: succinate-semialdehyde dehydrogenase (NADP(+)) [Porticoccus sp.]|jgi:succinate-semialdehyde dehydrogenase/glutarate-semialdehyde dehydrogenase|nr:succinate-semialdehyde dehydrogenase (NADP(+)) [Porticoccus sp.]
MNKNLILKDPTLLTTKAFINGEWIDATSGKTLKITNPANGHLINEITKCGAEETKKAIQSASIAQKLWQAASPFDRSNLIRNWYNLIIENKNDLAEIITAEQGKPIHESLAEVDYGSRYIEWFAEEAKRICGDVIPGRTSDKKLIVTKNPVGLVACITPWNFPFAMLARKISPALAAGCSVVCKPDDKAPLSGMALILLADRAGIPKGLINAIVGDPEEIGNELTKNPLVKKISFTGSTVIGKKLMRDSSDTVKRTSMELGGNAPFIVFNDANIDLAVEGAINSKFRNSGQTCICTNRFLIQSDIYDEFSSKFVQSTRKLALGFGNKKGISIGPLITEEAADRVYSLIANSLDEGANILIGGNRSKLGMNFVEPTIIENITKDMRIFSEEIFGPVAALLKFKTEIEALSLANESEYGLAAYFYTRDISRISRLTDQLDCGILGINECMISTETAPFGGIKESGHGREGSKYGLDDYMELKYVCLGGV